MANHEYRIARGEILRMLYRTYPSVAGDNLLRATFVWITEPTIEGHVEYLIESGYVTREDIDPTQYKFSTAKYLLKITPKGIDLLEDNIDADPGIDNPLMG